jgi:hypothetical protein
VINHAFRKTAIPKLQNVDTRFGFAENEQIKNRRWRLRERAVPVLNTLIWRAFMTATVSPPRKKAKIETERMEAIRASAAHLADLRRAHARPLADVRLPSRAVVRLVCPVPEYSWCSSPAQMCAELAE